jgi:hypothetical protein
VILFDQPLIVATGESVTNHFIDFGDEVLHIVLKENNKTLVRAAMLKESVVSELTNLTEKTFFYSTQPKITLVPTILSSQALNNEIIAFNFYDVTSVSIVKSVTQQETIFFEIAKSFEELAQKTVGNLTCIVVPILHLLAQKVADTLLIAKVGNSLFIGLNQMKKLVLFNGFTAETTDELLYYTMLTVQQYQLNPSNIQVTCLGDSHEVAQLKDKLMDYFLNVEQIIHPSIVDMRYSGFVKLITG